MARMRVIRIPDPVFTRKLLLNSAWLIFLYMALLALFEFIELVRPKPPCPYADVSEWNTCPKATDHSTTQFDSERC